MQIQSCFSAPGDLDRLLFCGGAGERLLEGERLGERLRSNSATLGERLRSHSPSRLDAVCDNLPGVNFAGVSLGDLGGVSFAGDGLGFVGNAVVSKNPGSWPYSTLA